MNAGRFGLVQLLYNIASNEKQQDCAISDRT